ncbi:glycosyltransferase [Halorientalis brevis]|uniref:Glycosyltransferase n=1 Tax=Halorientalis brevis TaxID=1126241 RepID=A0ABD6C6P4_9EURY
MPLIILGWLLLAETDRRVVFALAVFTGLLIGYLIWSYVVVRYTRRLQGLFTFPHLVVALVGCGITTAWLGWLPTTAAGLVHFLALFLVLTSLWFMFPLATIHTTTSHTAFDADEQLPTISVIVPAYNEVGYIRRTVSAILNASYPAEKVEVVVVDDGSTDDTLSEALSISDERVQTVHKENGGKYSALNYGLLFASGDVVVCVDADSVIADSALKAAVSPLLADQSIGAVAGRVKIENGGSLILALQRLEYIVGLNVYRRVLDSFGTVPIVPGCLGAFRREAIEDVAGYDPETLTEDFDLTVKLLRAGWSVRTSEATVYTEAPDTWYDLYLQRMRWYRGNVMTLLKHWRVALDHRYGYLHRISYPMQVVEMFVLPLASWIILGVLVQRLLAGDVVRTVAMFAVYTSVVLAISVFAVSVERDDLSLSALSPLFVIGYKHFHDLLVFKSILEVCLRRDLDWTGPRRILNREQTDSVPEEHSSAETRSVD